MPKNLKESVQRLVELVGNTADAFTAALFLIDDDRPDTLRLYAHSSLSQAIVEDVTIPLGHGLIGWVAKNERPTHAKQFERDTRSALKFYRVDEEIKSFAATPVKQGDRTVGVLAIDSKKQYVFTDKALKLLDDFAAAIARSLSLGTGRIKLREDAEAFEAVHGLTARLVGLATVEETITALRIGLQGLAPHDDMIIALRDTADDLFRLYDVRRKSESSQPVAIASCRMGHVIGQQRVINMPEIGDARIVPGPKGAWRSFVGAPMMVNDETVGAVGLLSRKGNAFSRASEMALFLVASSVANTFARLRAGRAATGEADTDPVTGLLNHRYLASVHRPFAKRGAVVMVNLLGLTHVNDQIGFNAADAVLAETGRRLLSLDPAPDAVVRPWGDRFLLFYDGAAPPDALAAMRGAVNAIEESPMLVEGADIIMRAVAGGSLFPENGATTAQLVAAAEEAAGIARKIRGERIALAPVSGGPSDMIVSKG
jgi:diguanylate cyclase (GGDEF)-like protein